MQVGQLYLTFKIKLVFHSLLRGQARHVKEHLAHIGREHPTGLEHKVGQPLHLPHGEDVAYRAVAKQFPPSVGHGDSGFSPCTRLGKLHITVIKHVGLIKLASGSHARLFLRSLHIEVHVHPQFGIIVLIGHEHKNGALVLALHLSIKLCQRRLALTLVVIDFQSPFLKVVNVIFHFGEIRKVAIEEQNEACPCILLTVVVHQRKQSHQHYAQPLALPVVTQY